MASKPRGFTQAVPVMVTTRCAWKEDLLLVDGVVDVFKKFLAENESHCEVEVLAWALQSNHLHLILRQRFDGHCAGRKRGIAAFMRNVLCRLTRYVNEVAGIEGRAFERVYRSHPIPTKGELFRYIAYVHGQNQHHRVRLDAPSGVASSAPVVFAGRPDGVVNSILSEPALGETLDQKCRSLESVVSEIVSQACLEEIRIDDLGRCDESLSERQLKKMKRQAWREAAEHAAMKHGIAGLADDVRDVPWEPLSKWIGDEAVSGERDRVVSFSKPVVRRRHSLANRPDGPGNQT